MIKTSGKLTEAELLALLKQDTERAFNYLYENYAAALYGVIFRVVLEEDRANDVLQDTFIKIWKNKESYDSSKGTIFTWMLNIARNAAIDSNRSKHVKYKIQVDQQVVDNENSFDESGKIDLIGLKETVEKLKPEYKKLIDYIYLLGYTQQEYSDMFDIPLGTVKTRTRSAIQELRQILNTA